MLAIVAGGMIGGSLSFGFLALSPSGDVQPITRILYGGLTVTGESTLDDRLEEPQQIEPLETVPYRINFLTSAEMTTAITQLISERGQVAEVVGKNSVVVTDIRRVHDVIGQLIGELDIPRTGSSTNIRRYYSVEVGDGTLIYLDGTRVERSR